MKNQGAESKIRCCARRGAASFGDQPKQFARSRCVRDLQARIVFLLAILATALLIPIPLHAQSAGFPSGSLIIPMDIDYQNSGMLKAYGLVDKLLRAGVPVRWCILSGKTLYTSAGAFPAIPGNSVDFTTSATDFVSGATISAHGYRGGPFVIAGADVAVASPIITAWQAIHPTTAVHVATQAFTAPVRLLLTAAPRIAVLADGNQNIVFAYLNAAGITDEANLIWTGTSVNLLTPTQIAGPSTSNPADGALFSASGLPKFCALLASHWAVTSPDIPNVVPEIQSFLQFPVHLFAECQAVLALEGEPPTGGQGKLLTTAGFTAQPRPPTVQFSSSDLPFAQLDGAFATVGGSEPAFAAATGSTYYDSSSVMLRSSAAATIGLNDIWMAGYFQGTCPIASLGSCTNPGPKGKATYLGGHQYTTAVPISTNPTTQGVRLFLNSLLAGSCTHAEGQPVISITAAAPATTTTSTVTFTMSYTNTGPGSGRGIQLANTLPANASFVSATGGGAFSGGTVTWNLGDLAAAASGSVSVTVNLSSFGTYANQATASFMIGLTSKTASSNLTQTDYSVTPLPVLALAGVVSRKTHGGMGAFDVTVNSATPISGLVDVEPRTIGTGHTLVFTFNNPITAAGSVSVIDSASMTVGAASSVGLSNAVMVALTGIPDNKRVTVALTNVNGVATPFAASMGFLVGDVDNTRSANSRDISSVKARSGQTTDGTNFRFDLNATGAINASDISAVKARSGSTLTP